ncbi:hypothetical protein CIL02_13065 [Prevotella sp. P3-122]|nr:hypothetical protein CIL02_13065 [Prevotella sp. P3-122]
MAVLFLPSSALARETVTFDFAAHPWTETVGNITEPIVQSEVTLTTTDGGTPTRLYSGTDGVDLRVYKSGGSFTFTAPEGQVIEKIEFSGTVAATAGTGTYDSSTKTWTQPDKQVNAVTFTATGTNKITKAVLTIAAPGEAPEVVALPTAENIAAFKALDTGTEAELTLTDAKVLYVNDKDMIVEDATGAIDFYNIGLEATAGKVLNGSIAGKNSPYNGLPEFAKSSNTNFATVTVTDGDAPVAVEMTVAEAMAEKSYLKYVKLTDATLVLDGETYYLVNGDNKIQIFNKFYLDYTLPEAIKSIAGIIIPYTKSGTTIVELAPIAVKDIVAVEPIPEGDITSLVLSNPGFEACEAATSDVGTSGSAQGTDYAAQGWSLISSAAWSNGAVIEYGSTVKLNGVNIPDVDNAGNSGKALGITVGWGGAVVYKSAEFTFPAGHYTLKANAYNAGTAAQFGSKLGFESAEKTVVSSRQSFDLNAWVEDVVEFELASETTGCITIGGVAISGGSTSNGRIFFDNITISHFADLLSQAVAALNETIAKAQAVADAGLAPKTDINAAIATAQAATTETEAETVMAAKETLLAAVAAYNDVNSHFVAVANFKAYFVADPYKYASEESKTNYTNLAAKTPANADEADANLEELQLAARAIAESHAKAEGVADATDQTSLITNPNAEAMDGWTTVNGEGSNGKLEVKTAEPFTDAAGNTDHPYFDGGNWGASAWDVTFQQTVNLPKGKYMLSATSRASVGMVSFALFAGEARTEMPHVGASGELFNRGYNLSSVEFEVTEETADVNIGVQGVAKTIHEWMSFTRFQLVKLDKSEVVDPEPDPEPEPEPVVKEGSYYIKNVATGKYLSAGSWWGTHAVVNKYGLDIIVTLADGKYTLDTQLYNNDSKHYLNGEYADGDAFGWTFTAAKTSADADAVIINNGSQNLTAQEDGLVILGASVEDNAKWVFVPADEFNAALQAELATATEADGKDATMLVKGQGFLRYDRRNSAWTDNPGVGGGAGSGNSNTNAEKFNKTFDVNQTVTVPDGKYTVEIQGFYRNGNIASAAAAHVNSTEQLLATFYANSAEAPLPSIFSEAGKVDDGATAEGIDGKFPDNQAQAGYFFNTGAYNVVLENVVVVGGALKIGVKKSETAAEDWTCFDNVRLTYFGAVEDLSAYKEAYEAALAAATTARADEANSVVTGEELTALNNAIDTYATVEDTKDAYVAATSALNAATSTFTSAVAAYQALKDTKAEYESFDTAPYPYASSTKKAAIQAAVDVEATSAADATAKKDAILTAVRDYVESNAVAEEAGAVDYTSSILNPNAEDGVNSWTKTLGDGSGGEIKVLSGEPFTDAAGNSTHKYFDGGNWDASAWDVTFSQDVTLPSGEYLLSATTRASQGIANFILFAGNDTKEMTHIGNTGGIFNRGWNDNFVVFNVHEDNTAAKIGVRGIATTQHEWMSFTRFRLVRLGDANIINGIQTENLDNATIYSVNGQVVRTNATTTKGLAKGVYVVNGKKVVVK